MSVGVISARIPLDGSSWRRIRVLLRRRPLEEQVEIPSAQAIIHVAAEDYGTVDLSIEIVNFSTVSLQVEQVQFDWLGINGMSLPAQAPQPLFIPHAIKPRSVAVVSYRSLLVAASVRQLTQSVHAGPNALCSPEGRLSVRGAFTVAQKGTRSQLRFEVDVPNPRIYLNVASARGHQP